MAPNAPTAPSSIVPLLYVWGDDELAAERIVTKFAAALEGQVGGPLERWDMQARLETAEIDSAQLHERLATPAMFGGGTLAVVSNPGALGRRNETRDRVLEAIALLAAGNALVIIEAAKSNAKGPGLTRFADAVKKASGTVRGALAPKPTGLGAWIAEEARARSLELGPGAARELADRLGARVTEGDVDRRFLSRIASGELDKLALRHALDEGPVTPDDVRALVTEITPSSLWSVTDAVGDRRGAAAASAIDRALETTPEPVLLTILHRRIVELLELGDRLTGGASLADAARVMGISSEYRAKTLAGQARRWTTDELTAALAGLVELDAMVKGVPGLEMDPAQRRLAFLLWVRERVGPG
jgi:DNA polymerase III delta subunit